MKCHSHPQCLFHADGLTAVATEVIKTYYDVKRPCWSEASAGQLHALCVLVHISRSTYVKQVRITHVKCIHMQCVHLYIACEASNIPDLAVQGFADSDCSGDVIIPRPRHHNLCVALTCIAVLHLHRQTCSALMGMCVSMSSKIAWTHMGLHITCTDRLTVFAVVTRVV